jgi:GNAT superfamily N-acetyltransferase
MVIEVTEEEVAQLSDYAHIPIAFEVRSVLDIEERAGGLTGLPLTERALATPYVKDYDAADGGPERWPSRFDVSRWGLFAARSGGQRVGGAAVAFGTDGVEMLEERDDLAVLWDLRVAPDARGRGVGAALFRAAEAWAAARGCRQLKVETQTVNVPACRFYVRMGCVLGGIHRFAYPDLPDEVQLLWYKALPQTR